MTLSLGLRDWGVAELFAGLTAACGLRRRAGLMAALETSLSAEFGRPALLVNSGRTALRLALSLLCADKPQCKEVIVPALACPALRQTLTALDLVPVYVDIGADLNTPVANVAAALTPRTLAVIMVHAYGLPADAGALEALCRTHDVALIDDAAQYLDGRSGMGRCGRFGVISFAQSKSVVTGIDGSGGILLINDAAALESARKRVAALPLPVHRRSAWLEFLLQPYSARLAYYLARWRQRYRDTIRRPAGLGTLDAALAVVQLGSRPERYARRREHLAWYARALADAGIVAPQLRPASAAEQPWLARLLVHVPAERRSACRRHLAAAGIRTRLPYELPSGLDSGKYPVAARAAASLLELPMPAGLKVAGVAAVVATLQRGLADYGVAAVASIPMCEPPTVADD